MQNHDMVVNLFNFTNTTKLNWSRKFKIRWLLLSSCAAFASKTPISTCFKLRVEFRYFWSLTGECCCICLRQTVISSSISSINRQCKAICFVSSCGNKLLLWIHLWMCCLYSYISVFVLFSVFVNTKPFNFVMRDVCLYQWVDYVVLIVHTCMWEFLIFIQLDSVYSHTYSGSIHTIVEVVLVRESWNERWLMM